jgi:hypothetical protein
MGDLRDLLAGKRWLFNEAKAWRGRGCRVDGRWDKSWDSDQFESRERRLTQAGDKKQP